MKDLEKLKENHGELVELATPSGNIVVLRQQNGEDDDILSNSFNVSKGISMSAFLSNIIIDSSFTERGTMTVNEVLNLRIADAYFMMVASRIFSLGQILNFEYRWEGLTVPTSYEEDLNLFIWDYSKPFPIKETDPDYFKFRIKPISKDTKNELTIKPKNRKVRYSYMTLAGEQFLLKLPDEKQSRNSELLARNLEEFIDGEWIKVESFKFFSSYEMAQIRQDVELNDPALDLVSELKHPLKELTVLYPIFGSPDFFYPRVI